jgi:hypothetical protein
MTADRFRKLALALPETEEGAHHGHPDFRVRGKIFASLGPKEAWGMVRLTPDQQAAIVGAEPAAFQPFNGSWGRQGGTKVLLASAKDAPVRQALKAAWTNTAPPPVRR